MLHPAILKAEFQRPHIAGLNQLAGLDAQVWHDVLASPRLGRNRLAPGGTEGQVVGPKGGAGES